MATWPFLRLEFIRSGTRGALGPARVAIIEAIERYGSLAAAAKSVGRTYRQVWTIVQQMNDEFGEIIIVKPGRHTGGASLSPTAVQAVRLYRDIESKFDRVFADEMKQFDRLVGEDSRAPKPIPRWAFALDPNTPTPPPKKRKQQSSLRQSASKRRRGKP